MILSFPVGSYHGWGVCGKYLSIEFNNLFKNNKLNQFEHIYYLFDQNNFDDMLELNYFLQNFKDSKEYNVYNKHKSTLFAMTNNDYLPNQYDKKLISKNNFGYIFFEHIEDKKIIKKASKFYDKIFCGSSFNEEILNNLGITNTKTVLQGIDTTVFNSCNNQKQLNKDKFVIFSGGKFEYRKAQDIIIKAFKLLSDKYDDVLLVTSWYNFWTNSINSMRYSDVINFTLFNNQDYFEFINKILINNHINPTKVISYPIMSNKMMASVYKNSDIGIFPNRCEGGTNLVMMEYLACGKPVIASNATGHKDIINSKNSLVLEKLTPNKYNPSWQDVSVDEVYQKLEYAYLNYHKLKKISKQASRDLSKFTWQKSAKTFLKQIKKYEY